VKRTLLTNQAGMRNLGADKQGLFSVALIQVLQNSSLQDNQGNLHQHCDFPDWQQVFATFRP
jgi:hypothetical protein